MEPARCASSSLKRVRSAAWALVALCAVGGGTLYLAAEPRHDPAAEYGAAVGGPFELVDQNGKRFSSDRLDGRPFALFFGFTRCPDVCPTTLMELAALRRQVGPAADDLQVVFVSVDPEQDRPEDIRQHLTLFDMPVIGLTGAPAQLATAAKAYGAYWRKVPLGAAGDYTMDHTATVFLMGDRGEFVASLDRHEGRDVKLAKLRRLVEAG